MLPWALTSFIMPKGTVKQLQNKVHTHKHKKTTSFLNQRQQQWHFVTVWHLFGNLAVIRIKTKPQHTLETGIYLKLKLLHDVLRCTQVTCHCCWTIYQWSAASDVMPTSTRRLLLQLTVVSAPFHLLQFSNSSTINAHCQWHTVSFTL